MVVQVDLAKKMRDSGDFGMTIVSRGLLFVPDPDFNLNADDFSANTFKPGWAFWD